MNQLCEFLNEILDDEFCIEVCLGIQHETRENIEYILDYCYKRLHKSDSVCVSIGLVEKLEKQKRRLVTFCLLRTFKEFKYDEWNLFRCTPIPELISKMLNVGSHDDAFLLWRRHCGGKYLRFTVDESLTDSLETILPSIPEDMVLDELVFFLQNDVIPRLSSQIQL